MIVYTVKHPGCGGIWFTTKADEAQLASENGCIVYARNEKFMVL